MRGGLAGILLAGYLAGAAHAQAPPSGPPGACLRAATAAERRWGLPVHLLEAIGEVESGRRDAATGSRLPWPWSINVGGAGYVFAGVGEAAAVVELFRAHGMASIDVGCFQVNLHYHPDAFVSVSRGFDPEANADYAARFLHDLFQRSGSWAAAIGAYHSADPILGDSYRALVLRAWRGMSGATEEPASDPHVILASASAAAIPIYTRRTLPPAFRAILGVPPLLAQR